MDQYWTEADGEKRTDVSFDVPEGYSNSYDEMGGSSIWGPGGLIFSEVSPRDMEYDLVKPLFSAANEPIWFFEISGRGVYVFDGRQGGLFEVTEPSDVESIVERLSMGGPYEVCLNVDILP
ncbi:hypothetical protein LIA77_11036 [Sarocladium implicatum]|nr:hypothetical protein LIA77_11036 [Sarocladium implicatum]